jgi:hypothetical protein
MEGKTILINSDNRNSGTSSDFTFTIPTDGDIIYTHVCVLGCNIPVSYNLVQSPYNTFTLREDVIDTVITIPAGNYNVNSFNDVLTTLLNTLSPHSWKYTITFNNDFTTQSTGLYTFTCTLFTIPPMFIFPPLAEIHTQFGFANNSTNVFSSGGVLLSSNVVSFIPQTVLTIYSNICENRNLLTIFHDNAIPYSNISYQCQTELYSKKLSNSGKDSIYHFSLINKNGVKIDLNGLPMLMNLLLYKIDDSYKQDIKDYIRYKLLKS